MKRKFISMGCVVALAANSVAGLAQQPVPTKEQKEVREVVVSRNFTFEPDGSQPTDHLMLMAPPPVVGAMGFGDGQNGFQYSFTTSLDGKVVKGQPYSAEAVNEHIQTLSDGNRIVRRSTSTVARDSEGRTRKEASIVAFGPLAEAMGDLPKQITIYDPVAGTTFMLNPQDKTASKMGSVMIRRVEAKPSTNAAPKAEGGTTSGTQRISGGVLQGNAVKRVAPVYPDIAKAAGATGAVQVTVTVNENGEVTTAESVSGHPLLREAALDAARQWKFKQTELDGKPVKAQGQLTFNFTLDDGPAKEAREKAMAELKATTGERVALEWSDKEMGASTVAPAIAAGKMLRMKMGEPGQDIHFISGNKKYETRKESLGTQSIEGVSCEGTRSVMTIPAGDMGNELPISVVTETWFSPELQVTVLRKFNDPRYGEDIYRLTNINRTEPAKALFEIPAEYTIKEGPGMFFDQKIGEEMRLRMRDVEEKVRKLQDR